MLLWNTVSKIWHRFKKDDLVQTTEMNLLLFNVLIELRVISELLKNNGDGQPSNPTIRQSILDE